MAIVAVHDGRAAFSRPYRIRVGPQAVLLPDKSVGKWACGRLEHGITGPDLAHTSPGIYPNIFLTFLLHSSGASGIVPAIEAFGGELCHCW